MTSCITNGELFQIFQLHENRKMGDILSIILSYKEEQSNKNFNKGLISTGQKNWALCKKLGIDLKKRESIWLKSSSNNFQFENCASLYKKLMTTKYIYLMLILQ